MLNVITEITIQQIPNSAAPNRNKMLFIRNLNAIKVDSGWEEMIDTAEIIMSRKTSQIMYCDTEYDGILHSIPFIPINDIKPLPIKPTDDFEGFSTTSNSVLNYGDMIQIRIGYSYYDNSGIQHNTILDGNKMTTVDGIKYEQELNIAVPTVGATNVSKNFPIPVANYGLGYKRSLLFTGYITSITDELKEGKTKGQSNIHIKCQDYAMFFFQLQVPDLNILSTDKKIKYPGPGIKLTEGTTPIVYNNTQVGTLKGMFEGFLYIISKSYTTENLNNLKKYQLKPIYPNIGGIKTDDNPFAYQFSKTTDVISSMTSSFGDRFGDIVMEHSTVGDYMKKISDDGWAKCFFYPNSQVLNMSIFKYNQNPYDYNNPFGYQEFTFEYTVNIINSKLEYKKVDHLLKGAIVKSTFKVDNGEQSKPIQVFVGEAGGQVTTFLYGRSNDKKPTNSKEELALEETMRQWGVNKLKETYYQGYYGSFTIKGFPYIRHGDHITILDKNYPEREGTYKCKSVKYTATMDKGLLQEISLDYLISKPKIG